MAQALLGHASTATTERYTAADDDEMRAAMMAALWVSLLSMPTWLTSRRCRPSLPKRDTALALRPTTWCLATAECSLDRRGG